MMGAYIAKPTNKDMVDRITPYLSSDRVEAAFRAVDRGMYYEIAEGEAVDPYDDDPWRRGNLHLSAPCIYAQVVEALQLRPGLSFLNLGSGTGYLNTIVGLLVGPNGINHGVEYHKEVIAYAEKKLSKFKEESFAIDRFDFSEPVFVKGNCLNLNPNLRYDRLYLGAACLPEVEDFVKGLIKPNCGILVMPFGQHLVRYIRTGENDWTKENLMDVNFTQMIAVREGDGLVNMPIPQPSSLKELSRIVIRQYLRERLEKMRPFMKNRDNFQSRIMRRKRDEVKRTIVDLSIRDAIWRKRNGPSNEDQELESSNRKRKRSIFSSDDLASTDASDRKRNRPTDTHNRAGCSARLGVSLPTSSNVSKNRDSRRKRCQNARNKSSSSRRCPKDKVRGPRLSECERYHTRLITLIKRLPIPPVLHSYLDYERRS